MTLGPPPPAPAAPTAQPLRAPASFWIAQAGAAIVALTVIARLGDGYGSRLAEPRGYYLVAADGDQDDVAAAPGFSRPARTAVVVVDGLGEAPARTMRSAELLARDGQCLSTDVGPVSLSRPVYAAMSTGVEQDRTGVRLNAHASPIAAESIWEVARGVGLRVTAVSDLAYWRELFPRGFDEYRIAPTAERYVAEEPLADLTLLHPDAVDEAGHAFGAASKEYAAAVGAVDAQLEALLARVDLARDLVVLTADHGHTARGGHGGRAHGVAQVLTCFAGRGVRRGAPAAPSASMRAQHIAPVLAALLGVRAPRHVRAGDTPDEDGLELSLTLLDRATVPASYFAARRAAAARLRATTAAALRNWTRGGEGTWRALEADRARERALRLIAVVIALAAAFGVVVACRRRGERLVAALYALAPIAAATGVWIASRGSIDFSSINGEPDFLHGAVVASTIAVSLAVGLHARAFQSPERWARDHGGFALAVLALLGAHIAVYGWRVGPPLPGPVPLFIPYPAAVLGAVASAVWLGGCLALAARTLGAVSAAVPRRGS